MSIKYVTMMKDYKHTRQKGLKKLASEIENSLVCVLCNETVTKSFGKVMKHEPFTTQMMWSLN